MRTCQRLRVGQVAGKQLVATSVDLLGEATVTSAEADRYAARCREALDADGLRELHAHHQRQRAGGEEGIGLYTDAKTRHDVPGH